MKTEMLTTVWILHYILLLMILRANAACPERCHCSLDNRGRRQVLCLEGGMEPTLPISKIDKQTEVLIVEPPEDAENSLTIGPIFQQFKSLEVLRIVRSNIPAIGTHSFWGVPTLKILDLSENNITQIVDPNFRGLENLLELHLSDNHIRTIPSGTFRHLYELKILSLARNQITELVPRLFLMLGKLKELDLSGNRLMELSPEVFKDVQELRALRCRSCGLRSINPQIYHLLPYLSLLDLGDNEFKYIMPDEFTDLHKLQHLWLDGNQLPVVLEKTFVHQTELISLSLARNRLAKVTNTAFMNLSSLQSLDISYNKLSRLETETFHHVTETLLYLNVSGNYLAVSELKNVLPMVPKVLELGLADLSLSDLPSGLFVYQDSLRKLNLSRNHFVHFPVQVLSPLSRLVELDLSVNRFRGLDERSLARFEKISVVRLANNPWSCDLCHIVSMVVHVERSNGGDHLRGLYCVTPHGLAGREIISLYKTDLDWCTSAGVHGYGDTEGSPSISNTFLGEDGRLGIIAAGIAVLLLIVTGIALAVGMCYSKRHAANYYTNEEKRGPEHETMFETPTAILGENGEISFKFPLDISQTKKKVSISTIDEIKKDPQLHVLTNGT